MDNRKLIIITAFNRAALIRKNLPLFLDLKCDILLVDDGSTDSTYDVIKDQIWMKYIKHELHLGSGASFITGCQYARDLEYDVIILMDLDSTAYGEELTQLMEHIDYGYDIVSSSRILENYDYQGIPQNNIDITSAIASELTVITGFDLTDPLSGTKAIRMDAIKDMELTEFNDGVFLQLWIQAHYYGLAVIEIPSKSGSNFGHELGRYPDPLGLFLALIETEKYLYPKKDLN
ncbi:MAG: glycosyltransferase [Smithella sp.]|nr:glycosyltransferase [Smithella sp.]